MSPKTNRTKQPAAPTSPWTDCFQASPVHSQGEYSPPTTDTEQQSPTTVALHQIYDLTHRS